MKKYILITLAILFLGMTVLSAHPASLLNVTFDKDKDNLIVSFVHKVKTPQDHFIHHITVQLNKKDIISQNTFSQDTTDGGTIYYKVIDAKVGDKISVTVDCNKSGKKSETILVK